MNAVPNKRQAASILRWTALFVAATLAAACGDTETTTSASGGEASQSSVAPDQPYTEPTLADEPPRTVPTSTTLAIEAGSATVRLTFSQEDGSGTGPDRPWPEGLAVIITPSHIEQFWETITGRTGLESFYGDDNVLALEGNDDVRLVKPSTTKEALAAAPAIVVSSNENGEAEAKISAGDYLFCGVSASDPGNLRIINCEDIRIPQDSHVTFYDADATVFINRREP